MSVADVPRNLRLLCSYGRSVSDICRRAGINRHQFERYLTGRSTPSLRSLRRICDFFGLEDHEIFLDHAPFASLVRVRPPRLQPGRDHLGDVTASLADGFDLQAAQRYVGFYHLYFQPDRLVPEIHRSLMRVSLADRCLVTRTIERYPGGAAGLPPAVKYRGVLLLRGTKLIVIESQINASDSTFFTIVDGTGYSELTYLSGISLGIAPDGSRTTYSLRIVWHYLGTEIRIRERLGQCGQLPLDSPELGTYLRHCVENDLTVGDPAFVPRA